MSTVATKLEVAVVGYLVGNWQGVGEPLNGAAILAGSTAEPKADDSYVSVLSGNVGGAHARQGCYEVDVAIHVVTHAKKQNGEDRDRIAVHEERVEALAGIFGEAQVSTVKAALVALDEELGVSGYWGYDRENGRDGMSYITTLRKVFAVFLAEVE